MMEKVKEKEFYDLDVKDKLASLESLRYVHDTLKKEIKSVSERKVDKNQGDTNAEKNIETDKYGNIIAKDKDEIPDKLPNPHKLIFEGAVTAEYDGSSEVTVKFPDPNEKLDKNQGVDNAGKALVIGEDGNVVPGEVQSGGDGIAIVNTMSGESPLLIPDSAERPMKDLKLFGKTEQLTTTGKNLFDLEKAKKAESYDTVDVGGTEYKAIVYKVKPNTDYTLSISGKASGNITNLNIGNTTTQYSLQSSDITSRTINSLESGLIYVFFSLNTVEANIEIFYKQYFDIQLEKGNVRTSYEPYTGGKPSPSPEYPQEIKNVGKYNEETGKYEVDVVVGGSNLLKENFSEFKTENNIAYIPLPEGHDNHNYTMLIQKKTDKIDNIGFTCGFYDKKEMSEAYKMPCLVNGRLVNPNGIVTDRKGTNHWVCFTPASEEFFDIYNVMYVEGIFNRLLYQPYIEPQTVKLSLDEPLRGIGDYKDEVTKGGIVRRVVSETNNTLDSFNSWNPTSGSYRSTFTPKNKPASDKNNNWICDMFNQISTSKNNTQIFVYYTKENLIAMGIDPEGTKEEANVRLKEFISKNPFTFEYALAEPTTESLPEDFKQALKNLSTHYPTTVISTDGGELDADVEVTYTADTKNYIDNKFEQMNKAIVNTQAQLLQGEQYNV